MDALILNAGHSQLEEQLKIAAACGVAEREQEYDEGNDIMAVVTEDESTVDDNNEGLLFAEINR